MATYYTKKCPFCGFTYQSHELKNQKIRYGSPIRTCVRCGKVFIDKDYKELAITGIPSNVGQPHLGDFILLSIFPAVLAYLMFSASTPSSTSVIIGMACVALIAYLAYDTFSPSKLKKEEQFFKEELEASIQRLKNPNYVRALQELGYNIPLKYRKYIDEE